MTATAETDASAEAPYEPFPPNRNTIEVRRREGATTIRLYPGEDFTPARLRAYAGHLVGIAEEAASRDPELDELIDAIEDSEANLTADSIAALAAALLAAGYKRQSP